MTSERAQAYGRVMTAIGEAGLAREQQQTIREVADSLLFCGDLTSDDEARGALETLHRLAEELAENGEIAPETIDRLVADVEGCGPMTPAELF